MVGQSTMKDLDAPVDKDGEIAADEEDDPELADVTLAPAVVDENLGELDG